MRFFGTLLRALIGLAVIAVVWWGAASVSGGPPGPVEVTNKVLDLLTADVFQQHARASLDVLAYTLLPALLAGIVIGAAAGGFKATRWLFEPFVLTIAAAPLAAILPLLNMWLRSNTAPNIVFVLLVTTLAVANTIMLRWPKRHLEALELSEAPAPDAARASGRMLAIVAGLRVGIALGVAALVVAEFVGSNVGLGYFVRISSSLFSTADAMAGTLVILLPTIAAGVFLQAIEEQLKG